MTTERWVMGRPVSWGQSCLPFALNSLIDLRTIKGAQGGEALRQDTFAGTFVVELILKY